MGIIEKRIGSRLFRLRETAKNDNLTKAVAKSSAIKIRKMGGYCRVVSKPNGKYQLWVQLPHTFAEIKEKHQRAGNSFFSRENTKFFSGYIYSTWYNPPTGITYLRVINPNLEYMGSKYYRFNSKTGNLDFVKKIETPFFNKNGIILGK